MTEQEQFIGWSQFALDRNLKAGLSSFTGTNQELIDLIILNWDKRTPGAGRKDLSQVVLVPIVSNLNKFTCPWVHISNASNLRAVVESRREGEDPFVAVYSDGPTAPVNYVNIVLYHKDTLLENNGTRSGNFEWEIVAIIASPIKEEPMEPLTMSRNYLEKEGGTFAPYTSKDFAESIYYWKDYVKKA